MFARCFLKAFVVHDLLFTEKYGAPHTSLLASTFLATQILGTRCAAEAAFEQFLVNHPLLDFSPETVCAGSYARPIDWYTK